MRTRMRSLGVLLAAIVAVLAAPRANGQVIRRQTVPESDWWTSLSIGVWQSQPVTDGSTGSTWDFGNTVQYRATLDRTISPGVTLGVAATFARAPLTYSGPAVGPTACGQCDADANITQVFATFHAGGRNIGFHQVIEGSLGTTLYSDIVARNSGTRLPPNNDNDLAFALGYGYGYNLSPYTQIEVVEELAASIHQNTNLPADANTIIRSWTTRIGVRVGLGR